MTKKELTELARKRGIKGYAAMSRAELEAALGLAGGAEAPQPQADQAPAKGAKAKSEPVKAPDVAAVPPEQVAKVKPAEGAPAEPQPEPKATTPEAQPAEAPKSVTRKAAAKAEGAKAAPSKRARAATRPAPKGKVAIAKEALKNAKVPVAKVVKAEPEPEVLKPKAPPLKQTWTNHALLIDEVLGEVPAPEAGDRAVLLVRDPRWVYVYWELSDKSVARAKKAGGKRLVLRAHDVTDLRFDGQNSHHHFDVAMPYDFQRKWYLEVPADGRSYLIEIGYKKADGKFLPLTRSNPGTTPLARMSGLVADRFASPDAVADRPAPAPVAPATAEPQAPTTPAAPPPEAQAPTGPADRIVPSAPAQPPAAGQPSVTADDEALYLRMRELSMRGQPYWSGSIPKFGFPAEQAGAAPSSSIFSSWAPSSERRPPAPSEEQAKDFWLVANCELIVYGATEPDAKVTLRGVPIELRPDGTFTFRFALPDGHHPFPIHAVNADGDMERSITISVSRQTQTPS